MLINNSPKSEQNNCIYKIPCNNCNKIYIGQTNNLNKRLYYHKYAIRSANLASSCYKHVEEGHTIDWNNVCVLVNVNNYKQRNFYESVIIQKTENINFNLDKTNYCLDSLTLKFIWNELCKNKNIKDLC